MSAKHVMQFRVKAALYIRMLGKQVPGPCKRCRCRFMTSHHHSQHFVMHLLRTQSLACLIVTRHQYHREQVSFVSVLLASLIADGVYYLTERTKGGVQETVTWDGHVEWWSGSINVIGVRP